MGKTNQSKRAIVNMTPAMRALSTMKYKDLQLACILRGMPSKDMIESDHSDLVVFFTENFERGEDQTLLPFHWDWMKQELLKNGHKEGDLLLSPFLKLGYTGDIDKMEKPINTPKISPPKEEKKPKAQMDEKLGVRKGTKKAMTYELTQKGWDLEKIIKTVLKHFPDAQEKSIKIWQKRCQKANKKK